MVPELTEAQRKRFQTRVARARMAARQAIKYKLGAGGINPAKPTPADKNWFCDCSGLVAWVFGLSRVPKRIRPWWIETTAIWRDAKDGKPGTFVQIDQPIPGCAIVYPDKFRVGPKGARVKNSEGHVGVVTDVVLGADGAIQELRGVDCSSSQYRRTGRAVHERDLYFMVRNGAIFVVLEEDLR